MQRTAAIAEIILIACRVKRGSSTFYTRLCSLVHEGDDPCLAGKIAPPRPQLAPRGADIDGFSKKMNNTRITLHKILCSQIIKYIMCYSNCQHHWTIAFHHQV